MRPLGFWPQSADLCRQALLGLLGRGLDLGYLARALPFLKTALYLFIPFSPLPTAGLISSRYGCEIIQGDLLSLLFEACTPLGARQGPQALSRADGIDEERQSGHEGRIPLSPRLPAPCAIIVPGHWLAALSPTLPMFYNSLMTSCQKVDSVTDLIVIPSQDLTSFD